MYKISADDKWYVLCWVGKDVVESYSEGREVSLALPEGTVDATVYSVKKDGSDYRVVFYLDVYYKAFCESRAEDLSLIHISLLYCRELGIGEIPARYRSCGNKVYLSSKFVLFLYHRCV